MSDKDKRYKVQFLSMRGICLAMKPKEAFIVNVDDNGEEISRERVGKKPTKRCPYCGKSWKKHNQALRTYTERNK